MATKTRVRVQGTIGKSVRLGGQSTASANAVLGVNVQLPNGTTPTLTQLAALLALTLNDQPGNINPGTGGAPATIWQNIQYVPPNVTYSARYAMQEEDSGEEYYSRMAVPGPAGPRGFTGLPVAMPADDLDDALTIPGPKGDRGAAGLTIVLAPEDPDDPTTVPGPAGIAGAAGSQGPPGLGLPGITIPMYQDDAEDALPIPGIQGNPGAAGVLGRNGQDAFPLYFDDLEDAQTIPGPKGDRGLTGISIAIYPEDPDDYTAIVPGPQGQQGVQGVPGANGSGSAAAAWAAYIESDPYEDVLNVLRNLPNNPQFQSIALSGVPGAVSVAVNSGSGASVAQSDIQVNRAGSTANTVQKGPCVVLADTANGHLSCIQNSGNQTEFWQFNGASWSQMLSFTSGLDTNFPIAPVASSATAGSASALPVIPAGYWIVQLQGIRFKLPYYNV